MICTFSIKKGLFCLLGYVKIIGVLEIHTLWIHLSSALW